jgi:hypothetical protein
MPTLTDENSLPGLHTVQNTRCGLYTPGVSMDHQPTTLDSAVLLGGYCVVGRPSRSEHVFTADTPLGGGLFVSWKDLETWAKLTD